MAKKRDELERLRELNDEDLHGEIARLKESVFRLNFKLALGDTESVKRVRGDRKMLARVQTLIRQRSAQQQMTK